MTQRILTGSYSGGYSLISTYDQLTITSTGSVGGSGVTVNNGQSAVVLNQGRVSGGMTLANGGAVANEAYIGSTGVISDSTTTGTGYYGRAIYMAMSTSSWATTVELDAGGSVNNHSVITNGVSIGGVAGRVSNSGTIGSPGTNSSFLYTYGGATYVTSSSRTATAAVVLGGGALVSNSGSINGVSIASGTILNQGVISALYSASRSTITENGYGRAGDRSRATITTSAAVTLSGGSISNGSASNTTASIDGIAATGTPTTVVNDGVIGELSTYWEYMVKHGGYSRHRMTASVSLAAGGSVTNGAAADHAADIATGVAISGAAGNVTNFGAIGAGGYSSSEGPERTEVYASVVLADGGSVTNGSASDSGAYISSQVNVSSGTVTNFGVIGDGSHSHYSGGAALVSVILGSGDLINGSAGHSAAIIENGVNLGSLGTLTNFGTIESASGKGSAKVTFGAATDRLIEEGSGVLATSVNGDGGTLELAAAAGAGSVTGLGVSLADFASVVVDAGAGWRLYGSSKIAAGETLTNSAAVVDEASLSDSGLISTSAGLVLANDATLTVGATGSIRLGGDFGVTALAGATDTTLVNHGQISRLSGAGTSNLSVTDIVNDGTITAGAGATRVAGTVAGVGAWQVAADSTLAFAGSVGASQIVNLAGAGSDLELTSGSAFAAAISGFGAGRTIDLRSLAYGSQDILSWSQSASRGTLTVTRGAQSVKLTLLGQFAASSFALSSDGHGGADITSASPQTPAMLARPTG